MFKTLKPEKFLENNRGMLPFQQFASFIRFVVRLRYAISMTLKPLCFPLLSFAIATTHYSPLSDQLICLKIA